VIGESKSKYKPGDHEHGFQSFQFPTMGKQGDMEDIMKMGEDLWENGIKVRMSVATVIL
jgi:hypothetical protein